MDVRRGCCTTARRYGLHLCRPNGLKCAPRQRRRELVLRYGPNSTSTRRFSAKYGVLACLRACCAALDFHVPVDGVVVARRVSGAAKIFFQSPPGVTPHGTSYSRVVSVPSRYLGAVSVASACKNNVHFTLRAAVSRRPSRRAPHALTSTAGWVNMGILPLHGRLAATRRKASFRHLADPK